MQPIIKPYIDNLGNRLTEFPILFPDGEVKPAYTLASLVRLLNRSYDTSDLNRLGLIYGIDFIVKNTTDLPDGATDMNILGAINGKRTVLSLPGLIKLVMSENGEYMLYNEKIELARSKSPNIIPGGFFLLFRMFYMLCSEKESV